MARTMTSGTSTEHGPPDSRSRRARRRCSFGCSDSSWMDLYSPFSRATNEQPWASRFRHMDCPEGLSRATAPESPIGVKGIMGTKSATRGVAVPRGSAGGGGDGGGVDGTLICTTAAPRTGEGNNGKCKERETRTAGEGGGALGSASMLGRSPRPAEIQSFFQRPPPGRRRPRLSGRLSPQ